MSVASIHFEYAGPHKSNSLMICGLPASQQTGWIWCCVGLCEYTLSAEVLLILQVYIWFLHRPSEGHCQPHSLHHVTQQWQRGLWVFPDLVSHSLIALNYCWAKTQLGTTTFTSFSWAEYGWAEWCRQGGCLKWKGSCSALIAKIIVRAGRQWSPLPILHCHPPLPFLRLHHYHGTTLNRCPSYTTEPWLDLNTNSPAKRQLELRGSHHVLFPVLPVF